MKISGKRLNLTKTLDGACYIRVKNGLKRSITKLVRRSLNREIQKEVHTKVDRF